MIHWICVIKDLYEHTQLHYSRNLALRIWRQSHAIGGADATDIDSVSRPVSDLTIMELEGEEGLESSGRNVWRLMSENVACLALIRKTEAHIWSVFYVS